MRAGLTAHLSPDMVSRINTACGGSKKKSRHSITIRIIQGDVTKFDCDVLMLKFADRFQGADYAVAKALKSASNESVYPFNVAHLSTKVGNHILVESNGAILANQVLFVSTDILWRLSYDSGRELARGWLQALKTEDADVKHVAMTVHGIEAGLDIGEVLEAQIAGLVDAIRSGRAPEQLETISIVERAAPRVLQLEESMSHLVKMQKITNNERDIEEGSKRTYFSFSQVEFAEKLEAEGKSWVMTSGGNILPIDDSEIEHQTSRKSYALAIIPDGSSMEDFFYYGIQRPIHAMGLLCEQESTPKAGDIASEVDRRMRRISEASVVICDATSLTKELYLLIGFAWGRDIPTVFLNPASDGGLKWAEHQIIYKTIRQLEENLGQWLKKQLEGPRGRSESYTSFFASGPDVSKNNVERSFERCE